MVGRRSSGYKESTNVKFFVLILERMATDIAYVHIQVEWMNSVLF